MNIDFHCIDLPGSFYTTSLLKVLHPFERCSRDYNYPSKERGRCECRTCDFHSDVLRLLLLFQLEAPSTVYLSADFQVHDFSICVRQGALLWGCHHERSTLWCVLKLPSCCECTPFLSSLVQDADPCVF